MKIIKSDWEKLKFCLMTCGLSCKNLFVYFVCLAASEQPGGYAKQLLLAVYYGLSFGVLGCRCSPVCLLRQMGVCLPEWRQMRLNFDVDWNFVISLLW
jgi:hypothetical protein